jgi:hypothetical protein
MIAGVYEREYLKVMIMLYRIVKDLEMAYRTAIHVGMHPIYCSFRQVL